MDQYKLVSNSFVCHVRFQEEGGREYGAGVRRVPPKICFCPHVTLCELVKLMHRIPTYNFAHVLNNISIDMLREKVTSNSSGTVTNPSRFSVPLFSCLSHSCFFLPSLLILQRNVYEFVLLKCYVCVCP
jgi:hypothetical protein